MNMSNSATHSIRFSGAVYGASKGSYIEQCVYINIHMAPTVVALKVLVSSFTHMFTYITGLTRVSRVNSYNRDAIKQSLVLQKQAKLSKRPSSEFGSKGFVSSYRSVCLYTKRTPNLLPMLAVGVKPISRMLNTIRGYYDIRDSKIATYKIIHAFSFFLGNFYGLTKEKRSFFVNQVRFSLDKWNIRRFVAHKINFLPTSKTPQRHHIVCRVGQNSSIRSNSTKWFECGFRFLVQGIRICHLGNRSYQHLRRKLKYGSERMVNLGVQFNCIKNLLLPCYIRNGTAGSIGFPHGLKEHYGLLIGRQKLDFQGQFHHTKLIKVAI